MWLVSPNFRFQPLAKCWQVPNRTVQWRKGKPVILCPTLLKRLIPLHDGTLSCPGDDGHHRHVFPGITDVTANLGDLQGGYVRIGQGRSSSSGAASSASSYSVYIWLLFLLLVFFVILLFFRSVLTLTHQEQLSGS